MKAFISSNTLTISLYNGSFELIYLFQQIVRYVTKLKLHLSTQRTGQAFIFNYQLISLSVRCNSGGGKTPTWFIKLSENGCVCKKKKKREAQKYMSHCQHGHTEDDIIAVHRLCSAGRLVKRHVCTRRATQPLLTHPTGTKSGEPRPSWPSALPAPSESCLSTPD